MNIYYLHQLSHLANGLIRDTITIAFITSMVASLLGLGYVIWFFTNVVWLDSDAEFNNIVNRTPYRSFLLTNYSLMAFFLTVGFLIKIFSDSTEYAENFIEFIVIPIYSFGIYTMYVQKKTSNAGKSVAEELPDQFFSMAELYNVPLIKRLIGKKRKTDFKCIYCTQPLSVLGRFTCRAGHSPSENRYIFDNCHQCNDVFEYIRCKSCGKDIELYAKKYNQEELDNRGKEYISRKNPFKGLLTQYLIWNLIFYIHTAFYLSIITKNLDCWYGFTLYVCVIGLVVCISHYYFYVPQKDMVMENPYKSYQMPDSFFKDAKSKFDRMT